MHKPPFPHLLGCNEESSWQNGALLSCPVRYEKSDPCSHKEVDTHLLLHVSNAVQKGCKKVTICTVDTDVVVLAVAMFRKIEPEEMWIALGSGTNLRLQVRCKKAFLKCTALCSCSIDC